MTSKFYDDLVEGLKQYNRDHEPIESSILKICKLPAERPGLVVPVLSLLSLIGSVLYILHFGGV
jgi:hypothetical protein